MCIKKKRLFSVTPLYCIAILICFFTAFPTSAIASQHTKTKNPIVLVHGFLGFDSAFGVDYWYGIANHLAEDGATVYTSDQSSVNDSQVRGEQLIGYLEELQAIHGHSRFNLIGHSQGGFESRYVASVRPDLVASVTAVGSPVSGSGFADFLTTATDDSDILRNILVNTVNVFGTFMEAISGGIDPQNADGARHVLSYAGASEFARKHPQAIPRKWCGQGKRKVNGIRYYSFTGNQKFTNFFDPTDYAFVITGAVFGDDNDGAAGRCASHLGKVVKDNFSWNHVDEINQMFGIVGWGAANPLSVYRSHVNRLKKKGL